jgi:hypothetical protein
VRQLICGEELLNSLPANQASRRGDPPFPFHRRGERRERWVYISLLSSSSSSSFFLQYSPLQIMLLSKEVPTSHGNSRDHGVRLQSAGHNPTRPIMINDDDNSGSNIEPPAPPVRYTSQVQKSMALLERDRMNLTSHQTSPMRTQDIRSQNMSRARFIDSEDSEALQERLGSRLGQQRKKIAHVRPRFAHKGTRENPIDVELVSNVRAKKPIVEIPECSVCGDSCPGAELPSLAGCEHPPQTCSTCYTAWLAVQLRGSSWREAKCPVSKCKVKLTYQEIQQYASSESFQQYDTYIAHIALNEDRKFGCFDASMLL